MSEPTGDDREFIVAEVSKNWPETPETDIPGLPRLLSQRFEVIIAVNLERGYKLQSFDVSRVMEGPGRMNETIIAVFQKVR